MELLTKFAHLTGPGLAHRSTAQQSGDQFFIISVDNDVWTALQQCRATDETQDQTIQRLLRKLMESPQ